MQEVELPISESWTVVVMSEKGVPEVRVQDHEHFPNAARKVIKGIIQKMFSNIGFTFTTLITTM